MPDRAMPDKYMTATNALFRFLDTDGDGGGTKDAIGDYDGDVTDFYIQPPANEIYRLARMIIFIESTGNIASGKYGDQAALTNGIQAICTTNGHTCNLFDSINVKTHDDWAGICHDSQALNYGNVAGKSISVRWSFFKSGEDFWLNGAEEAKLIIRLSDDLSGLVHHRFFIQGRKFTR